MKKRLLITSIVMMLVVAVALSTATYAWFTSNDAVSANSITMVATTNTAPTLGISWTNGNYTTDIYPEIDTDLRFSPVAPVDLTEGVTTDEVLFKTASAYSSNGQYVFKTSGQDATTATYTWADSTEAHTSFFVKNLSESNPLVGNLVLTATITGRFEEVDTNGEAADTTLYNYYNDSKTLLAQQPENAATVNSGYKMLKEDGSDLIRVGVFKKDNGTFKLLKVLANQMDTYTAVTSGEFGEGAYYKKVLGRYVLATAGDAQAITDGTADYTVGDTIPASGFYTRSSEPTDATAVYGTITADQPVNTSLSSYTCATSVNVATNLAANTAIELKIIVWMDGAALGNNQQSKGADITLDFSI